MSHPPSPRHRRRNLRRIGARLFALCEALDLPDRRALLPPRFAGEARRTLAEAEALLGGGLLPPPGTRNPGDLFASAVTNLRLLSERNRLGNKANPR